ncbi:MAG: tetratricopeptide repeat protein [Thaumarchaeota archaeon]|nr:tetratricopeptide repeat protein [Nitrososphaerota archaeon]
MQSRKLAAIMFTDIVGFTALTQRDEGQAMRLLAQHNELMRTLIPKYSGREVKTIGDAFLVEFRSALEAVQCSVAMQRVMHERNMGLPSSDRLEIRVGIHVGDVISNTEVDGDIFGDTVNISSRIEQFAPPGGVCLSEQVFAQVKNKVDFPLVRMESQKLKNVELPVDLYRVVMPWEVEPARESPLEPRRVAVLPFKNMSPDPNDEFFSDGLTEEVIASLSNVKELTVIARTSVMQYRAVSKKVTEIGRELNAGTLVEGSIRKAKNRIRVTVQMIDAQKDGHLWAQNYDRDLDDIFAIQSDIAERVTKELRIQLVDSIKVRLETEPTAKPEAYTLYIKGRFFWNERTKEAVLKAIEYFELSIKKDPSFALGYSGLANCYQVIARNGLGEYAPNFQKVKEYAVKALELDPDLPEAHAALGAYLHYYEHNWKQAEAEYTRAITLKPSYATAHQWYSHVLVQQGRLPEAFNEIFRAMELDPFSPVINENYGNWLLYNGEYKKAIEQFRKVLDMDPARDHSRGWIVQAFCSQKMFDEALQEAEAFEKAKKEPLEAKLWKAYCLATMSRKSEARNILSEVEARYQEENISPEKFAEVHFLLGEKESGFEWLERAYSSHDGNINMLLINREFDGVREDERFLDLLKRIGLPPV